MKNTQKCLQPRQTSLCKDILIKPSRPSPMIGGHWLEVVFWSPARGGQTTRNMKILANIYRIRYGMQVRTFENYEAYGKYHFMENLQKQNRQKKKGHVFVDCRNDRNRQVWRLFQRADTVVINFPQEYPVLLNLFSKSSPHIGKYLLSYQQQSV